MKLLHAYFNHTLFACVVSYHNAFSENVSDTESIITWEQKLALDKFRERVAERLPHGYMKQDLFLTRFLRANAFDIPLAEKHLLYHLKWRKDYQMDSIHNEDWSNYKVLFPYWMEGHDKEGRPIQYFNIGHTDIRRAVFAGESYRVLRYIFKAFDEMCILTRELTEEYKNVTQGIMIVNMDGYSPILHGCLGCRPIMIEAGRSLATHFNGCFQKYIIINGRREGEPLLEVLRRAVSLPNIESTRVFTRNKSQWLPYLLKFIDRDQLPLEIGGTKAYPGLDDDFDVIY